MAWDKLKKLVYCLMNDSLYDSCSRQFRKLGLVSILL
jgi:hypothetical protein